MSQAVAGKAFGWMVEVKETPQSGTQQFNVAEPSKERAVEAVRRRIAGAAAASVEAKTALTSHMVYGQLRMKRGQVAKVT